MSAHGADRLDAREFDALREMADTLIPAAHGMPSAASVIDERRLAFLLDARPDLEAPLRSALRPELAPTTAGRLRALEADPEALAALQLAIVAAYYADADVRRRIGYPGQIARPVDPLAFPEYVAEGLLDAVVERGPIWRDPGSGRDEAGGES
jgi:hypothetical protein